MTTNTVSLVALEHGRCWASAWIQHRHGNSVSRNLKGKSKVPIIRHNHRSIDSLETHVFQEPTRYIHVGSLLLERRYVDEKVDFSLRTFLLHGWQPAWDVSGSGRYDPVDSSLLPSSPRLGKEPHCQLRVVLPVLNPESRIVDKSPYVGALVSSRRTVAVSFP